MGKRGSLIKQGYVRQDFSDLLLDLRSDTVDMTEGTSALVLEECEEINHSNDKVHSLFRQRIMSNESVHFIYSVNEKILHEKHCDCVKLIPDEELEYLADFNPNMQFCESCALVGYVRVGAKDPENITDYVRLFERMQVMVDQLRSLYVDYHMKTRAAMNTITVWCKEDTWKIVSLNGKGHVQLLHNNYRKGKKGTRVFTEGFHVQNLSCQDTTFDEAFDVIRKYEYKPENAALHISKAKMDWRLQLENHNAKDALEKELEEYISEQRKPLNCRDRILHSIRKIFYRQSITSYHDFHAVKAEGFPEDHTICIYLWENKKKEQFWQIGYYHAGLQKFVANYGTVTLAVNQDKVLAWRKMTPEALRGDLWK